MSNEEQKSITPGSLLVADCSEYLYQHGLRLAEVMLLFLLYAEVLLKEKDIYRR